MASIVREFEVEAAPEAAWAAVRDVGGVHRRLCPGVLSDAWMDGDARVVVFAAGFQVRERIVALDDARRRLAYAATGGRTSHHNASLQVFPAPGGGSRDRRRTAAVRARL